MGSTTSGDQRSLEVGAAMVGQRRLLVEASLNERGVETMPTKVIGMPTAYSVLPLEGDQVSSRFMP